MEIEKRLADYVVDARYEDLPKDTIDMAKAIMLNIIGTTIGGGAAEGVEDLVSLVKGWGGKAEATIFIHGGKVPAPNAVLVNSYIGRALDFECAGAPGHHPPVSYIPVALAAAEMVGGISGKDFLTAVIAGSEVGYRINAATKFYGWDPTGYGPVYSSAAVWGKILGLNKKQMLDALGIAFNRQAGSFQANIDGTLCVRLIQGFTSQSGLTSAILAQRGFTGVRNFVEGIYGQYSIYSTDKNYDRDILIGDLGKRYDIVNNAMFKRHPSCGGTLIANDLTLELAREHHLTANDVEQVTIKQGSSFQLVGAPFEMWDTPRVNAQFSVRYVVANILARGEPKLTHFEEGAVRELASTGLVDKVTSQPQDPTAGTEVIIRTKKGDVYRKTGYAIRGRVANGPLSREELMSIFSQCVEYGGKLLPKGNVEKIIDMVDNLEQCSDVRQIIPLFIA